MVLLGIVGRYYTYRATVSAGFYLPVSVVYLQRRGLGLTEIGAVQAVFLFALVVAEIPTGYLGDRLGRRAGLAVGNGTLAAVMIGFVLAETTLGFAVVYAVWAVAWTFRSGTAAAWLYELLGRLERADEFTRISGRADAVLAATSAVTAVAGGALFTIEPAAPFVANAALAAAGVPVLYSLPETTDTDPTSNVEPTSQDGATSNVEPTSEDGASSNVEPTSEDGASSNVEPTSEDGAASDDERRGEHSPEQLDGDSESAETTDDGPLTVRRAAETLRAQIERPSVRWLVVYAALFNVAFSLSRVFEQPAAREVGVSIAGLGGMYAVFKLVSAAASAMAGPVEDRLGRRGALGVLVPAYGVAYGAVALAPLALLPALVANRGLRSLTTPVRNGYLNDRLGDMGRATVLSGVSMVLSVASGTANAVGGVVASRVGPVTFLWTATVAVAAAGAVVWLATTPVRSPTGTDTAAPAE